MKKIGVSVLILLLVFSSIAVISAQNNETTPVDEKAYAYLENKVRGKCSSLNFEEQVFSLLALSYNSDMQTECAREIEGKSKDNKCWPDSPCNVKDTSLAIIALDNIGKSTAGAEQWMLENSRNPDNLEWYLEIDSNEETSCDITHDTTTTTIKINKDKKISGSTGICFSKSYNNYWLKIQPTCLNKKISISCDKDFISTIIYKKDNSNVWYVSSKVESASSEGTTQHNLNSFCISTGSSCEYEDNLWAALALQKSGHDISGILPYLTAFAENNEKFSPHNFLYSLTNSDAYLNEILRQQKEAGFWDMLSGQGKYYDTALSLLVISESEAVINAKTWLTDNQKTDGSWNNNIRDTGFLLWAGWPKTPAMITTETTDACKDFNYYCMSQAECTDTGGDALPNFYCSGLDVCCSQPKELKSCSEEGGTICTGGDVCSVSTIRALDTEECCLGSCGPGALECEQYGYYCRSGCLSDEEEIALDCEGGDICCKAEAGAGKSYWWLWLLIFLIILLILAIIFRKKLKIIALKAKNRFKKGPVKKTRPGFPPAGAPIGRIQGLRRMFPTRAGPIGARRPIRKPITRPRPTAVAKKSKLDTELEDTLKKLKEMSK